MRSLYQIYTQPSTRKLAKVRAMITSTTGVWNAKSAGLKVKFLNCPHPHPLFLTFLPFLWWFVKMSTSPNVQDWELSQWILAGVGTAPTTRPPAPSATHWQSLRPSEEQPGATCSIVQAATSHRNYGGICLEASNMQPHLHR